MKILKKFGKWLGWILFTLVAIFILIWIALQFPAVQTKVVHKITNELSKSLKTKVAIDRVNINFFKTIALEGIYIEDQKQDTLLYASNLDASIGILSLIKNKIFLNDIQLQNAVIRLNRPVNDSTFNFSFLQSAFSSDDEDISEPTSNVASWKFGIGNILLQNVDFQFDDKFGGKNITTQLEDFSTSLRLMDLENQQLEFQNITLKNTLVNVEQTTPKETYSTDNQLVTNDSSILLFPFTGWNLIVDNFKMEGSSFIFKNGNSVKNAQQFNANHLEFQNINFNLEDFIWEKENLQTEIKTIQLREKNGFQLNDFSAKIEVTPQRIGLNNFSIKTPFTQFQNTTFLVFEEFDDLVSNFNNITFTSDFSKTKIGSKDLEYFVAAVGEVPFLNLNTNRFIQLNGKIAGNLNQIKLNKFQTKIEEALTLKVDGILQNPTQPDALQLNVNLEELTTSYQKINTILKDLELPKGLESFGKFQLSGKAKGNLNYLNVEKFALKTEANTGFEITGKLSNLNQAESLQMNLSINQIFTNFNDLKGFSENELPPMLDSLGQLKYAGEFKGTLHKFELDGQLKTQLGNLDNDLFLNFNDDYSSANYAGNIRLDAFQLGKLLGDSLQVGEVTLNANLEGKGFVLDSLIAKMKMQIEKLEYEGYDYKNIVVDGELAEGIFEGKLDLNDPNAKIDFDGKMSFNEDRPEYQFQMLVDTLNLQNLNLYDEKLNLHAKLDMNFKGQQLNDFVGKMNLTEIMIDSKNQFFKEDSLKIQATLDAPKERNLSITSSFLEGDVKGDYDFDEMQDLMLSYINEYFPLDEATSARLDSINFQDVKKPQNFTLNFMLKDASPILLFAPQIEFLESTQLNGIFNSSEKTMAVNIGLKKLQVSGIGMESINLNAKGDTKKLSNQLTISNLKTTEGVDIPNVILKNDMFNDSMYVNLNVQNDTIDQLLSIAAIVSDASKGYWLNFENSMIANNTIWNISPKNSINLGEDFLEINDLIFSYKNQSLGINSLNKKFSDSTSPIEINFENFQIGELSKIANIQNTNFTGQLNGQFQVIDSFQNLHYNADLTIPDLALNQEKVGSLSIDFSQPNLSQKINVNVLLDGNQNQLNMTGFYDISENKYDVKTNIPLLELRLIDPIMDGIFGESKGTINGNFSLNGTPDKPQLNGNFNFNKASTIIDFTKTRYTIDEGKVSFDNQSINFGTLQLQDRKGDNATLSGKITHNFFEKMRLNINMKTDRFTFLNTQAKDNELFYGKLFLKADASIKGPVEQPIIEVNARTLNNSELNVSAFAEEENFLEESYIIFGNPNDPQEKTENENTLVYEVEAALPAEVRLNLELTDDAIFRVIVDPLTGDQLECRGNSNMAITLLPNGQVDIFGSYLITSGKYRFSYTDLVKRNFEIVQGSSVAFNGDPLQARFNVTAKYATEATPFELVGNQTTLSEQETQVAQQRQKVEVLMKMTGEIEAPQLNFDIALPEAEGTLISSEIQRKLAELRTNPSELNKQVFGLILFNGFITSTGGSDFSTTSETVVLGSVSRFVGKQLNDLASKYIKGVEINFDINSYKSQYANQGQGGTVTELGVGVTKKINDRLSLKAGGNIDLNSSAGAADFSQIAGDFVLEYKLTKSGNYLLKVFRKSDFDVLNEENSVKTGAGISVSKSFGGKKQTKN